MKPSLVGRFAGSLFFMWIVMGAVSISLPQSVISQRTSDLAAPACRPACERHPGARPGSVSCCGCEVEYLGVYSPGGKFKTTTRTGRNNVHYGASCCNSRSWSRPIEVPDFVDLHPRERVEENYEPPARAAKPAKGHSLLASLRDDIVTFAYGRERILLTPHRVTVDSRGCVLVVDPDARAVHVLADSGSFRIAGGPHRRLRLPNGIAVDAADNIYIADTERGLVLVYGADGKFLRYIGKRGDEGVFHDPTAIAIDRNRGRLYLIDSPRNLLFVLDLEGNILKRMGRPRSHAIGGFSSDIIPLDLDYPTEIAVGDSELVVVDSGNSRIRVMDLECRPVAQFSISAIPGPPTANQVGLGVDLTGKIYVSSARDPHIRIYSRDGSLLGSFGHTGMEVGEFNSPAGLWVDATNWLYVADTNNGRIQVFRVSRGSEKGN
jgi:DNA-binding beta-propeller fold protein YncE